MPKQIKIISIIIFTFGLLFLVFLMISQRFLARSLPQIRGSLVLPELKDRVDVYRDGYGIPHIMARNEYDLFFAQGFVTAQDRLWQMDFWKRAAKGTLSETFNPSTFKQDSLVLTIGIPDIAHKLTGSISKESQFILSAYTDGINTYIDSQKGKWPVEFLAFNYEPEKWQVDDCLAILRWTGWYMSAGASHDLLWNAINLKMGADEFLKLLPAFKSKTIPGLSADSDDSVEMLKRAEKFIHQNEPVLPSGQNQCLALSGNRTSTGKPILVVETLFPFTCPSILYENHLAGGGWNVSGFSFPGIPLIYIGYNQDIAWAFSSKTENSISYTNETECSDQSNEHRIQTQNKGTKRCIIRRGSSGPVVSESQSGGNSGHFLTLQWTGYKISDEILALYRLNQAKNWTEFRSAIAAFQFPEQQVVYADRKGNIGACSTGPERKTGKFRIQSASFRGSQAVVNPESGFIIKSDNPVWNESSDYAYRYSRIKTRLSDNDQWSLMDIKEIFNDVQSSYAEQIMRILLPALDEITFDNEFEIMAVNQFKNWSCSYKTGSYGAVLFHIFQIYFVKNTLLDELGNDLVERILSHTDLYYRLTRALFYSSESQCFDNISTPDTTETMNDMIKISMKQAIVWATREFGSSYSKWAWGMGHTLTMRRFIRHPVESLLMMENVLDLGPFPVSGDYTSIHCMTSDLNNPYDVIWGPTSRLIVDLHRMDNSISVLSTGQSGQFMDNHYRDQVQLLINHLYHPNLMDTTKVVQSGWPVLNLKPEPDNHE